MLPPEENGEIAVACAPMTMQVNNSIGLIPVAFTIDGTIGNKAGVTTPSVLLKKDMIPPTMHIAIGTRKLGTFTPIQLARILMVPALIATEISIPTPQIMIRVLQGTLAITFFSSPSFNISATTDNKMANRPMSIFELTQPMVLLPGRTDCRMGAASTITIMKTIRYRVVRCF